LVRWVIGILVGLFAALNVAVYCGGYYHAGLDILTNASPALFGFGAGLAGIALTSRMRRLATLALILAAAPPGIAVTGDLVGGIHPPVRAMSGELKVLSLNVWSSNGDLQAVEALIRDERPDIILLQEASTKRHRELLARLGEIYPVNVNILPHCSTRVLTRFELIESLGGQDCALVGARLAIPASLGGGEVVAVSVHLPRGVNGERLGLLEFTRFARTSAIIGGDFNRTPWSAALRRFDWVEGIERRTHGLATWPSPNRRLLRGWTLPISVLPIDHVYATRDWRTVRVRRGRDAGSDHQPVIVELVRAPR
jgi:endonuclease/exonuclease/phosphatase (EEP) superfamily protein YafD